MLSRLGIIAGIIALALTAQAEGKRAVVVLKQPSSSGYATMSAIETNIAVVTNSLKNSQINVESTLKRINSLVVRVNGPEDIEKLKRNPLVALVDVDVMLPAPKPVKGFFLTRKNKSYDFSTMSTRVGSGTPWGIKAVRAMEAWNVSKRGQGARVLVLDTGIDKDHPSLKGNLETAENFFETAGAPYPYADGVGHGTHVAGTIAAMADNSGFTGVAPSAKVLMGRVCGDEGCSSTAIAEGINWGIEQSVDVISMSLGGMFSPPSIRQAIQQAESAGVVVVAASGNDGTPQVGYPAALPTVIAVGAVDPTLARAQFSQYGPELDIMAPGVEVMSTLPVGSGRESVIKVKAGNSVMEIANAPVQGAGDFTGSMTGDFAFAGIGEKTDFSKVDVKGKVALMERGKIAFTEKVINAMHAGAKAVIIYNNEPGLVRGGITPDEPVNLPVFMIEQTDGMKIRKVLESGQGVQVNMAIESADYGALDGTSMACPHVSGVVALIRATNKKLTPAQVRDIIKRTAQPMNSSNSVEVGAGLVNAASAVSASRMTSVSNLF